MTTILGSELHRINADVVVIGGGTAGLNTALAAAEMGADVLVVDKAHIQRSGAIAGGIDHFFAYLETGEPWDTRDAYLAYVEQGRPWRCQSQNSRKGVLRRARFQRWSA